MRIHTSVLNFSDIHIAMQVAAVWATTLEEKGSRKRARAYEVKLSGDSRYRQNGGEEPAATWDQWGIFLAELYSRDPEMVAAAYSKSNHAFGLDSSKAIFDHATGHRFGDLTFQESHRHHKWHSGFLTEGQAHTSFCECGAEQRWDHLVGALTTVVAQPFSPRINIPVVKRPAGTRPPAERQPLPLYSDSQLWTSDDDRAWFSKMAARVAARKG